MGFLIWCLAGCVPLGLGIAAFFSKKPAGFWANVPVFAVTDVKKYNRAVGLLFLAFGAVLLLLGLPLLAPQNSAWILLSVLGVMLEVIAAMIVYSCVIEKRYKQPQASLVAGKNGGKKMQKGIFYPAGLCYNKMPDKTAPRRERKCRR